MQFTGWHSHVQPFPVTELMTLVQMPDKNEHNLKKLAAAVTAIYDLGYGLIDKTNPIVLQRLKTDDLDGK